MSALPKPMPPGARVPARSRKGGPKPFRLPLCRHLGGMARANGLTVFACPERYDGRMTAAWLDGYLAEFVTAFMSRDLDLDNVQRETERRRLKWPGELFSRSHAAWTPFEQSVLARGRKAPWVSGGGVEVTVALPYKLLALLLGRSVDACRVEAKRLGLSKKREKR